MVVTPAGINPCCKMLMKPSACLSAGLAVLLGFCTPIQAKKPFAVSDEIGLAIFDRQVVPEKQAIRFSPDRRYFAVYSERGRLDVDRVEDSLRFYLVQEVRNFLQNAKQTEPPSPYWVVQLATSKEGPVILKWRWLADSSGVAFLQHEENRNVRLVLADLGRKEIESVTPETESIEAFDFRDRRHYVYATTVVTEDGPPLSRPFVVGTARSLYELLFPNNPIHAMVSGKPILTNLWALVDGHRFEVRNGNSPLAIALEHPYGWLEGGDVSLSPNGHSVLAAVEVPQVPRDWERLYPGPSASDAYRIQSGTIVHWYVVIDLRTGDLQSLTGAPIASDAGLWAPVFAHASWSNDGQAVLLPATFLESKNNQPSRPCVAVVELASKSRTCLRELGAMWPQPGVERGPTIANVAFVNGDRNHVAVSFARSVVSSLDDSSKETAEFRRTAQNEWRVVGRTKDRADAGRGTVEVTIKQGLNEPPLLIATNAHASRAIWDPNPQLKDFDLGDATVYTWKDKHGKLWKGGLYKPVHYNSRQRYPLVIQTHGFSDAEFRPSGVYPSGFAARALAAADIVVLQSEDAANCDYGTPQEGACAVAGYEAAVQQLVVDGFVDAEKIGIIGFSHSGGYVLEELTKGSLRIAAALNEDTDLVDYFRYMTYVDYGLSADYATDPILGEFDSTIGAKPFGEGLQLWLKNSPSFNLEKVNAPLRIVAHGPESFLLDNWQTYASLRFLHKPVDLILMNPDSVNLKHKHVPEHVLSNPVLRLASQGGSVDWFRFWLQGYEGRAPKWDPDQYRRWEKLCDMQIAENPDHPTFCVGTKH